ncbi:DUF3826 domain-containing protein [Ferruginibacter sp.]|nr:DUF3826 domain-containing protein [Ferruginibacter sp.]
MKRFLLVNIDTQTTNDVNTTASVVFINTLISPFKNLVLLVTLLLLSGQIAAQQNNVADSAYQKVIAERSAKIVNVLGITDSVQYKKVQQQIAAQYFQLNTIHDGSKAVLAALKAGTALKEEMNEAVKSEGEKKSAALKQLHEQFIAQLKITLTADQIEKIKDGMTYRILPVTWTAYMDMLQKLTPEQKDKMYNWLVEARELAMDEGSSDAKHAVFGKYKGRINNYLSAAGYDMKKEGEEWAKRIQAAKEARQSQN